MAESKGVGLSYSGGFDIKIRFSLIRDRNIADNHYVRHNYCSKKKLSKFTYIHPKKLMI